MEFSHYRRGESLGVYQNSQAKFQYTYFTDLSFNFIKPLTKSEWLRIFRVSKSVRGWHEFSIPKNLQFFLGIDLHICLDQMFWFDWIKLPIRESTLPLSYLSCKYVYLSRLEMFWTLSTRKRDVFIKFT